VLTERLLCAKEWEQPTGVNWATLMCKRWGTAHRC